MGKLRVISLFSGAGGLDYGFEAAGFETAVALDHDRDSCATLRASRRWPVLEQSIFDVPTTQLLRAASLRKRQADVLIAGPPCQPFSKSGYWARGDAPRLSDPRADTLQAFLRVVEETLPRALLFENVEGLAFAEKDEGLQLVLKGLARINRTQRTDYRPTYRALNAADYGVPQLRERFFLVAARDGTPFSFPEPTHQKPGDEQERLRGVACEPYRTAWDAFADITPETDEDLQPRGKWANLLASIPEGQNYLWHTSRGGGLPLFGWRTRYWNFLLKLAKDRPSWTVQAQPGPSVGPFHWENRRLSIRELCALQTFPRDVRPTGGRISAQRQIGNAVPSLLAEVLARAIRAQLLGAPATRRALKLLPPDRFPPPDPEPVHPVPLDFHHLTGTHAAHPGTGRGRGALDRASVVG